VRLASVRVLGETERETWDERELKRKDQKNARPRRRRETSWETIGGTTVPVAAYLVYPNNLFKQQFLTHLTYVLCNISVIEYSYQNFHWIIL
jgi:hypothetical protein